MPIGAFMSTVALSLAFCFLALVALRALVHRRRTGSWGINLFTGTVSPLAWVAEFALIIGFALVVIGPVAALLDWAGGRLLVSSPPLHWGGVALTGIGIAGTLVAQLAMGNSWRVGVDEAETTTLVTTGVFAWIRNPIYTFMLLAVAGLPAMVPNVFSCLALVIAAVAIQIQVRAVEEPHLDKAHGAVYRRYAARIGRFVPGLGCLRAAAEG